jgi:hypothetical protein
MACVGSVEAIVGTPPLYRLPAFDGGADYGIKFLCRSKLARLGLLLRNK